MTLMVGAAPFGSRAAGTFSFEVPERPVRYLEPSARRVRGILAGETVVDSRAVRMVHETDHLAVWAFPPEDVRLDSLEGIAFRRDEPDLVDLVFIGFDDLDEWYEEDERVFGHARDPYSRIDVIPTSRHIRISVDGQVVADTRQARALFETGLPPRWYIPREDVRMDLLEPTDFTSRCAYKGIATYWNVGEERVIAWTYEDPKWDAERVRDLVCFFNERVDLELDGERQERPRTPWQSASWADAPQVTGGPKVFD